jgi:putative hemolysin
MTTALLILLCLVLSFFFSGMETGVLLLNRARVRHLKEHGSIGAGILLDFLHRPGFLSSTVLVGNTLVNGIATVLIGNFFLQRYELWAAVAAVLAFSMVVWFYGDLIPKTLFRKFPNRLTIRLAPVLLIFYWILFPIVQLFAFLSQLLIQLLGGGVSSRQMFVTRDELKLLAHEGHEGVMLSGEQRNLVASILDSHKATAREVMKAKPHVVPTDLKQGVKERRSAAISSQFSRLPVIGARPEKWDGLWVVYDSLFETQVESRSPPRIASFASLEETLTSLRRAKSPIGFVVDKEGKDIGIVTIEDVLHRYLGKVEL